MLPYFPFLQIYVEDIYEDDIKTRPYPRDPRPPIPTRVMVLSAMGLNLGVFGFLLTTHPKNNCVHDLRAPCSVLRLFVFTLRPWYMQVTHAPDEPWLF